MHRYIADGELKELIQDLPGEVMVSHPCEDCFQDCGDCPLFNERAEEGTELYPEEVH